MKEHFDVTGMSCSACSARVEKAVKALNGIDDVNVNLLKIPWWLILIRPKQAQSKLKTP